MDLYNPRRVSDIYNEGGTKPVSTDDNATANDGVRRREPEWDHPGEIYPGELTGETSAARRES